MMDQLSPREVEYEPALDIHLGTTDHYRVLREEFWEAFIQHAGLSGGIEMERRDNAYIWITWLTKLLSGENLCIRSSWFKSNFQRSASEKVPSDFDSVTWNRNHTRALREYRSKLIEQGNQVFTENQNQFTYEGRKINAKIGGKPDLIARNGNSGTIIDIKTGTPRNADVIQVQLYMWLVPNVLTAQHGGVKFDGLVVYNDREVPIRADTVNAEFTNQAIELIGILASAEEPETVPSFGECKWCDILPEHCPSRIDEDSDENEPNIEGLF